MGFLVLLLSCAPLNSQENIHSLFTGQKITLNLQPELMNLSMMFLYVLQSSWDHFGLTGEKGIY